MTSSWARTSCAGRGSWSLYCKPCARCCGVRTTASFYCGFVSRSQLTERLFFEKSGRFGFAIREHTLESFLPDPVPEARRSNMELRVLELRLRDDARGAPDVFASDDPAHAEATGDIA